MPTYQAEVVFDGKGNSFKNHVVELDQDGTILYFGPPLGKTSIQINGAIAPGWINTHCHIELSHLKNKIPTGTGLISFIEKVVTLRDFPQEIIRNEIQAALGFMENEGIVAIGDICNTLDTVEGKLNSPLRFYNFLECFDLFQKPTDYSGYDQLYQSFGLKNSDAKTRVPHAPYSVSPELFEYISQHSSPMDTISIHNQETPSENQFSQTGNGQLVGFYDKMNLSLDHYIVPGSTSLEYAGNHLKHEGRLLLVHNTCSTPTDVHFAQQKFQKVFWCTCPNANLYIENRLPDYRSLLESGAQVCIGTDSLSSNWQLSILEEIKTILKYNSWLRPEQVIQWACMHGAQALGMSEELGSLEVGKKPGLVQFEYDSSTESIPSFAQSKKLS